MRETIQDRIARLRTRKQEILARMKDLRKNSVRNVEHKRDRLNDQVMRITDKIIELEEGRNEL